MDCPRITSDKWILLFSTYRIRLSSWLTVDVNFLSWNFSCDMKWIIRMSPKWEIHEKTGKMGNMRDAVDVRICWNPKIEKGGEIEKGRQNISKNKKYEKCIGCRLVGDSDCHNFPNLLSLWAPFTQFISSLQLLNTLLYSTNFLLQKISNYFFLDC